MTALCKKCQNISSSLATKTEWNTRQKEFLLGTHKWHHVHADSCPFCKLIVKAMRLEHADSKDDGDVWLTHIPDGYILGKNLDDPLEDMGGPVIVKFLPNNKPFPQSIHTIGHGQELQKLADPKRMLNWFDKCHGGGRNHEECQHVPVWSHSAGNDRHGLHILRLIDVLNECIFEIDRESSNHEWYAVLSYVIGGVQLPKYSKHTMKKLGRTNSLDIHKLPKVYRDAIAVVKGINMQYLWIDAMCLLDPDAGDDELEDHQRGINNMDRIYQGAHITICAADSKSADHPLEALHDHATRKQTRTNHTVVNVPNHGQWGIVTGLYDRLRSAKYMSRGWTYQELVLSHRCLIFIDGMVFFRCRTRLYSEDAFWEHEDDHGPSAAALTGPYTTYFLPNDKDNDDPWGWYGEHLVNYSLRELTNDGDTVNAFQGILNRVAKKLGTPTLAGMPQSMLDMALIWYHRPDIAGGTGNCFRARHAPSWSWAAWTGVVVSTWIPEKKQRWVDHHAGKIEYWYTDENGTNLRQVDTGYPATYAPAPVYPPNVRAQFLQLKTYISTNFRLSQGSMGYQIQSTQKNNVLGIVYFDNGGTPDLGLNSTGFTLAQLCHAPDGDDNFDYGYGEMTGDELSADEVITVKPAISAKHHDLRWVLVLAWDTGNTYRRVGVGHIREHGRGWLDWSPQQQWIALY